MLEANIDDMTGEMAGYAMEKLLEEGALDVFYTPIYMKKNRPAIKLGVLSRGEDKDKLQRAMLKHTTTIGVRSYEADRVCMERTFETIEVEGLSVAIKHMRYGDIHKTTLEYEDCKKVATQLGVSLSVANQKIQHRLFKE